MIAEGPRGAGIPAGGSTPLNLIHRNKSPNPALARVSGRFYVVEATWNLRVFEVGEEVGGAFFDGGSAGRKAAELGGLRWLQNGKNAPGSDISRGRSPANGR